MKKIITSICLISALPIALLVQQTHKESEKEVENKEAPYEYFAFMRSYPDKEFDLKAYNAMLDETSKQNYAARSNMPLSWNNEGPTNIGGRITALAIHPTNSNILFAGCPGGGMFKSTDGGNSWNPVFDSQAYMSVSCIVFDPVNPNIMYAGTGDPDTPFTVFVGNGIYKSTDGGNTWVNIGLPQSGIISQILIDPNNTSIIYASAMGVPMTRDLNRGIYKSTNGGTSWTQVLSINNETGVSDMVMDFTNSSVIYATSWTRIRTNQESTGYSNATRVYKTSNGGTNWSIINNGLPNTKLSRYGICMSKQNANKLYVSVCDSNYQLYNVYVTTNGGSNFTPVGGINDLTGMYSGFGWYFGKIVVKPNSDSQVLISGVEHYRSTDGGANWFMNQPQWWMYNPHGDIHDIKFKSATNYIIATDGGLYETFDDGVNWNKLDNIPNTQFYKVNYNPFNNNEYTGGAQDNGTMYGGSLSGVNNWLRELGGDGFQPRLDFSNNQIRYAETQNGDLYMSLDAGNTYTDYVNGIDPNDRRNWDMPYIFGGVSTTTMFTGTYRVYKNSTNPVDNWNAISPDLTDGLIYAARFHNISCLDNSKLNTQYIYAGTSDGNAWRSLNGGATWTNVTTGLPNRYVTSIKASPNATNNVYVTHSGYRYNEYIPRIHKSTNNGTTWTDISGNLPQAGINDLIVAPGYENVLFIATDIGGYYTQDNGLTWSRLGNNMPYYVVWDLEFNPVTKKLIAGTYARGMHTLDVSSLLTVPPPPSSMNEYSSTNNCLLYPNPCLNNFKIMNNVKGESLKVIVYDAQGKEVLRTDVDEDNEINVSALPKGIYNVLLENGNGSLIKKLIKQ